MPSTQIDGRRFAWSELGEGPPLVLVNGYAASSADWDPTFTAARGSPAAGMPSWRRSPSASPR
jgi:pimeloyl-ACP methyl ester carboxylesterase